MNKKIIKAVYMLFIMALLIGFDQYTKAVAVLKLKGKTPFVLWNGVFEFFYSENSGAAFGILQGKQILFLIITVCVLIAAIWILFRLPATRHFLPLNLCAAVIGAGAAGNMIDRMCNGYVVDFLYFKLIDFPIFNVADCYVTTATLCLILLILFYYKEEELHLLKTDKGAE